MKRLLTLLMILAATSSIASAVAMNRSVMAVFDSWRIDQSYDPYLMLPDTLEITGDINDFNDIDGLVDAELGLSGQYLESYEGADDVILLNDDMDLSFYVANFFGGEYKEIYLEVTYFSKIGTDAIPYIDIYETSNNINDEYISSPDYLNTEAYSDGWITKSFIVYIEPNPSYELFDLNFETTDSWDGYPVYIDSIAIETVCVPEPLSLLSAAAGLTTIIARKRRIA